MKSESTSTEQAILQAAEKEFMGKGFSGARTASIAQEAGVTHAMLHYYFRTKEALFERVFDEKIKFFAGELLKVFQDSKEKDVVKRICRAVERHFDFVVENPKLPGFVFMELHAEPERLKGMMEHIKSTAMILGPAFQKELDKGIRQKKIGKVNFFQIMIDIMALNMMSVSMAEISASVMGTDLKQYLLARKKENVEVIRKRLLP